MSTGFSFDQARCTGCQACMLACTIENGLAYDDSWRTVYTFNERHLTDLPVSHLSLACNHCERPACLTACPANAYSKDAVSGFVLLDKNRCIGCRYCTWACPYGAPAFDRKTGVVAKCTFCEERQAQGLVPACVEACPTGALGIADRPESRSFAPVPGFPATDLGPAISFEPAANKRSAPELTTAPSTPIDPTNIPDQSQLSLTSEWPLAVFTYLTSLLVALLAFSAVGGQMFPAFGFVGIAAIAMLLSTTHLGRKMRAWQAILNPAQSWLSREIVLFTLLAGAGTAYLVLAPTSQIAGAFAVAIGILTLASIDRVYASLPLVGRHRFHSAGTAITGLFLAAVLLANPVVTTLTGVGKLILYLRRKVEYKATGKPVRAGLSLIRILFGFAVPPVVWMVLGDNGLAIVIAAVMLGELIDRLEFYLELEVVTPAGQMAIDLRKTFAASRPST
jgi:Fe-S-cluster-containing dehydrogenase component/DMSO reductase anchor subunit